MDFNRAEKKQLGAIASKVYEAEVGALLQEIDEEFRRWREGEIRGSELLATLHEFNQSQSREIWSRYQSMDDATIVARGVGLGLIPESEVPVAILAKLNPGYWRGE